ncbi:MAG: flagellar hook protein FlgK [Gammaproteobacteria bacterium]|nr:MAG: flagellar hook protein FlgK [Gammaproteobacteria bacterium]
MADLFGTGVSALRAFQRQLATTAHNVANASTPGYSRQRVELVTRPADEFAFGYLGNGVQVADVRRLHDAFLGAELQRVNGERARLEEYGRLADQVDVLLSDPDGGLAPALSGFFDALADLANAPADSAARSTLLGAAENLTARFNGLDARLRELGEALNTRLASLTGEVNRLAERIAELNQAIVQSQGRGHAPNDLLDQRDQVVLELSDLVAVSVVDEPDGTRNVFIGNGQVLVSGSQARSLTTIPDPADPARLRVAYQTPGGTLDLTAQLRGGRIGGLLDFRGQVLEPARAELGRLAVNLAEAVNAQHRRGMDLDGALGQDLFAVAPPAAWPWSSNGGGATVGVTLLDPTALAASDYELRYDGAAYTLTRLSDGASVSGPVPLAMDGIEVTVAGAPAAGDRFTVRPTLGLAGTLERRIFDPARLAAAAPVRTEADGGNLGDASAALVTVLDETHPDLLDTVEIRFDDPPTTFDLVNVSDATTLAAGVAYTPGMTVDVDGVRVQLDGAPVAGDVLRIEANDGGLADNRNALWLGELRNAALIGGQASLEQAHAALVGRVGGQAAQARDVGDAQNALFEQLRQQRDAVSGVNLDEEAADLLRFQQAYQAAARIIAVADDLFATLLDAVR